MAWPLQWQIQGRGMGSPHLPPLFLDQTETQSAKKIFEGLDDPPPYLKVWIGHCSGHC